MMEDKKEKINIIAGQLDLLLWDKMIFKLNENVDKDNLEEVMQSPEYQKIKLPKEEEKRFVINNNANNFFI